MVESTHRSRLSGAGFKLLF